MLSLGTGRYETAGKNNTTYTSLKAKLTNVISSATDTEGKFSDYTPYDVWGKKIQIHAVTFCWVLLPPELCSFSVGESYSLLLISSSLLHLCSDQLLLSKVIPVFSPSRTISVCGRLYKLKLLL